MKDVVKETVDRFLKDVTPYGRTEDFIDFVPAIATLKWHVYTEEHVYFIVATYDKKVVSENYLGCTVLTRKPRAGEKWNRGNDLSDGRLKEETWQKIKNAIIKYELVKLSPARKHQYQPDQPILTEDSIEVQVEEPIKK